MNKIILITLLVMLSGCASMGNRETTIQARGETVVVNSQNNSIVKYTADGVSVEIDNTGGESVLSGVGKQADGSTYGVAVGNGASGISYGVGVGQAANGGSWGAALGQSASAYNKGVALGWTASCLANAYSSAIGYRTSVKCSGNCLVTNISGSSSYYYTKGDMYWAGQTADATPLEIYGGALANERLLVSSGETLAFKGIIAAHNTTDSLSSTWEVKGAIQNLAGTTALVGSVTVAVIGQDGGMSGTAVAFTADDTNDALILTVTGIAAKTIRWATNIQLIAVK